MKCITGKLNLSAILCLKTIFCKCNYYICEAISESLAVSCQIYTEG